MEDYISPLENLGLTKNESKVYFALLALDLTTSKAIIESTHLHRQIVYDALGTLIAKGLVSFVIQARRKHFKAVSPKQIEGYLDKKEEEITKQREQFKQLLPKLEGLSKMNRENQEAVLYLGNKGIKSLLDDMLEEGKEIKIIGASDLSAESFRYNLKFHIPKFDKARIKKKIPYKIILSEDLIFRAKEINKMRYSEARILSKEFTSNSSTNIYSDRISIILWGSQPFGVLIKSKEIADSQRKHFDTFWKIAKKI